MRYLNASQMRQAHFFTRLCIVRKPEPGDIAGRGLGELPSLPNDRQPLAKWTVAGRNIARMCYAMAGCAALATGCLGAQRMGIPAGLYEIPANGASAIQAFCFDLTRASPTSSTTYSEVLTSPDKVTVTLGTKTESLQEALVHHEVEIRGRSATFQQLVDAYSDPTLMAHYTAKQRQAVSGIVKRWNALSPEGKAEIEREMAPELADLGDHTHLEFVNLTHEPMKVSVQQNSVLGERGDPSQDLPTEAISGSGNAKNVQRNIWSLMSKEQQTLLKQAGFYQGAADGKIGTQTSDSILEFQVAENMPPTGELDAPTESRLRAAATDQETIEAINAADRKLFLAATVQLLRIPQHENVYRISFGGGAVEYAHSVDQLAQVLSRNAKKMDISRIYLVPDGMSVDESQALAASLQLKSHAKGYGSEIKVIEGKAGDFGSDRFLAKSIDKIIDDGSEPSVITLDSLPAYQKTIQVHYRDGSYAPVKIVARTKELVMRIVGNIRDIFAALLKPSTSGSQLENLSVAELLNLAIAQTAHDMNVSMETVRRQVAMEFDNVEFVFLMQFQQTMG